MALSALCKNSKISLSIGFWLIMFTFSIYIYFLSNRLSDIVENKSTTQYFTIGYILPNFSFGIILAEFYIKGGA
jgi:ABC-type microcin C transport system permease subunit YejB